MQEKGTGIFHFLNANRFLIFVTLHSSLLNYITRRYIANDNLHASMMSFNNVVQIKAVQVSKCSRTGESNSSSSSVAQPLISSGTFGIVPLRVSTFDACSKSKICIKMIA